MNYRFRFSIGHVMGLIALSALVMANAIFVTQGSFTFHIVLIGAILFAGVGVLLYNRRLSRWMWVWIAGESGPLLIIALQALLSPVFLNLSPVALIMSLNLVCSFLITAGFTMTLRDIRRKLASAEIEGRTMRVVEGVTIERTTPNES
jgi:hypothetical protein